MRWIVSLMLFELMGKFLLKSFNNNVLFTCKMLAIVERNLSTTASVAAAVYVNHHGFSCFSISGNPDVKS
jgi:hypothetical protein